MTRREFVAGALASAFAGCRLPFFGTRGRLALNASTLRGYGLGLVDQVRAAVAGGFAGFEPWLKDVHAAKAAGTLGEAVAYARDNGLSFVNGIAFGRWADPDPAVRAAGLEETKRDMDVLAEMGCPHVAASMFGVHKPGSQILSSDAIAERFAAVCELGDALGVKPLLEYWGHSVNLNTPEAALDVLGKCGRADAAVLADVYHTYRGGGDFATFRRLGGGRLPVLHVNDYPATPRREELVDADRVWPGDGIAPWAEIFSALDEAGADPWLSIEVFNPAYWRTTPARTAREGRNRLAALVERRAAPLRVAGLQVGVQMWSVNDLWKKDPVAAFRRLRKIGYTGVQSFGFYAMDWDELEKMLDGEGLRIVDMPFYMKTLAEDEPKFVDFCARFGIDFAFEPYATYKTGAEWSAHAQELVAVAARLAKRGIRVGYHNHQHEIRDRYDGRSPADVLCAAGLPFELDVGHVRLAGGDPVEWLGRLKGRVPTIHAKPGGGDSVGGAGDRNDWPAIFAAASAAGAKWAVVECETRRDTYEDVEATMRYLKEGMA